LGLGAIASGGVRVLNDYYIDFRAEMDVLVAFSNCPHVHNACNAFSPKPSRR
jgi:uncharacterized protein YcgI (DUF1989 family)